MFLILLLSLLSLLKKHTQPHAITLKKHTLRKLRLEELRLAKYRLQSDAYDMHLLYMYYYLVGHTHTYRKASGNPTPITDVATDAADSHQRR